MNSENGKNSASGNSLSSLLFYRIREDILNGKFSAGQKITEQKLCQEYKVSRTPVREAFKQLELEGLIENIPNRGAFVLGFSEQDIEDIYELRKAYEIIAIKWAIERITEEEMRDLQEAYDLMEFYTIKGEAERMLSINTRFHEIIYKSTHSRFLEQILRSYQFYIKKTREVALQVEGKMNDVINEHYKILEAFKEKDISKGTKAIITHLDNSRERAKSRLASILNKK